MAGLLSIRISLFLTGATSHYRMHVKATWCDFFESAYLALMTIRPVAG